MSHLDAYLDPCPGFGWEGGPQFKTQIVELRNGRERRNAVWSQPRHRFTAPFNNISLADYAAIKRMHLVCRGMLHAFRFRDELDYTATNDQFGVGDGTTAEFQLGKLSTLDGVEYYRQVYAIAGTPTITVNGSPASATVNDRTGVVTFDSSDIPGNGEILRWSGTFDIWVRFATDDLPFSLAQANDRAVGSIELIEVAAPIA